MQGQLQRAFTDSCVRSEARGSESALVDQLAEQVKLLHAQLALLKAECERLLAIVEPAKEKWFYDGFTPSLELVCIEVCTLGGGVACNVVPELFYIFARFFGIKIPMRQENMQVSRTHPYMNAHRTNSFRTVALQVPDKKVAGKMTYKSKPMDCVPCKTHVKSLMPVVNQLHKLQVGEMLFNAG
jgi:hypothetical protein